MRVLFLRGDVPERLKSLFAKLPLLTTDDIKAYNDLRAALIEDIKPADTMEWLWLKDILDHSWEVQRLGQSKVALMQFAHDCSVRDRSKIEPGKEPRGFDMIGDAIVDVDALQASAERRRDKAFQQIMFYRELRARQEQVFSKQVSNMLIEARRRRAAPAQAKTARTTRRR